MKQRIKRRTFLASSAAVMALPQMESLAGESAASASAKKLVYLGFNFGCSPNWWDEDTHKYIFGKLKVLKEHQEDISILRNFDASSAGNPHWGTSTLLTCHNVHGTPGKSFQNAISCDQVAAAEIGQDHRYPSMVLSSPSSSGTGGGGWGPGHSLSWNERGDAIPAITTPLDLYFALFGGGGITREEQIYRLKQKKSMMDLLLDDIKRLNRELIAEDREKMEQYVSSIRQIELDIVRAEKWMDTPFPEATVEKPGANIPSGSPEELDLMYSLMTAALQNGSTRVITYRQSTDGILRKLGFASESHSLNHLRGDESLKLNDGRDKIRLEALGKFFDRMKEVKEANGKTLFDNTISSFACNIAQEHRVKDIPVVLAGGGLKHGQVIHNRERTRKSADIWLTTLATAGCNVESFADSQGAISEISA
ncbi:MAG: DUF1552 domain-containing protein [Verrucomicrobiota bacterium]